MWKKGIVETKEERFKRVAEARTRNVLIALRRLGSCAYITQRYKINRPDVEKCLNEIDKALLAVKYLYTQRLSRNDCHTEQDFKL